MKNYKLYISTIFTLFFLGAWSNLANADACDALGTAAAPMTPSGCDTAPDIYKTMVFEMGLCTTTPTLANRTTACTSVSSIPDGAVITVEEGIETGIPGNFTRPVNGSYTHGYVIMAPEFRLTATKTFSSNLSGQSNTAGDTCWTLAGSTRDSNVATAYDGATPTVISATRSTWLADCGTAASAAPAETIIIQDAFGGDTIESGNGDATAQATINGVTIKAHLTDNTMTADATTSAAVTRLVGFVTFAAPVAITDATSTFTASFRTTQGMELDPDSGNLKKMSSGPFVLSISVN